ncbi:S26 family signal peptidase [Actinomadura formosensis]|nr:S26 family signal peptidase [Actinomadura formosensis]
MTVVTVSGDSMAPALHDGDRVLVKRLPCRHVRNGDVVVVESPTTVVQGELAEPHWSTSPPPGPPDPPGTRNWIIKRVSATAGDEMPSCDPGLAEKPAVPPGHLFVLGDNPAASFDSRHFGPLPGSRMLGVVVRKLHL